MKIQVKKKADNFFIQYPDFLTKIHQKDDNESFPKISCMTNLGLRVEIVI